MPLLHFPHRLPQLEIELSDARVVDCVGGDLTASPIFARRLSVENSDLFEMCEMFDDGRSSKSQSLRNPRGCRAGLLANQTDDRQLDGVSKRCNWVLRPLAVGWLCIAWHRSSIARMSLDA